MLDGNLPYVTSSDHPDEMLSARLREVVNKSLVDQDLDYLSAGLEGRTTNPVSLLVDALAHPCADIGLEMEPLLEWRKSGVEVRNFHIPGSISGNLAILRLNLYLRRSRDAEKEGNSWNEVMPL